MVSLRLTGNDSTREIGVFWLHQSTICQMIEKRLVRLLVGTKLTLTRPGFLQIGMAEGRGKQILPAPSVISVWKVQLI